MSQIQMTKVMKAGIAALAALMTSAAFGGTCRSHQKPTVIKQADRVKITFAVSSPTDVAVHIENAKGEIVRHLVAGLLGTHPPEPLKPSSLAQAIEWDMRDDGRQTGRGWALQRPGGPRPEGILGRAGLADPDKTGPNRVGAHHRHGHWAGRPPLRAGPDQRWLYWNGTKMHVFRRDGAYEKTINPSQRTCRWSA